jgi:hypothetical protein
MAKTKQTAKKQPAKKQAAKKAAPDHPRHLRVDGGHTAFAVKLRAFLEAEDQAHRREQRRARTWGLGFGLFGLLGVPLIMKLGDSDWVFVPIIVIGIGFIGAIFNLIGAFDQHDELVRGKEIQAAFDRLKVDFHPKTPIKGEVDIGEATDTPTERTATSPYSGATKRYYRHTWLDLRWAFADGNLLALSITDLVKTKAGSEIRREHQLRGLLRVNPGVYRASAEPNPVGVSGLRVMTAEHDGATHIYFWGTIDGMADVMPAIEQVYRQVKPVGGDRQTLA